jgi:hypothetical protein
MARLRAACLNPGNKGLIKRLFTACSPTGVFENRGMQHSRPFAVIFTQAAGVVPSCARNMPLAEIQPDGRR